MPKRFSNVPPYPREPEHLAWQDLPTLYWKALGITVLIGIVTGVAWISWYLFDLHVLR